MAVKVNKKLIKRLLKQSIQQQKRIKQILYHQKVIKNNDSTQQQKLNSHHRLRDIGAITQTNQINQLLVMSNLGDDIGDVLDKQGGLAKSIFPFESEKTITQSKWEQQHFGKKEK